MRTRQAATPTSRGEEFVYKDKGCQMAGSCLSCPFETCLEEVPRGRQHQMRQVRAREMRRLYQQGKGTGEIARLFSVSRRTVQRELRGVQRCL